MIAPRYDESLWHVWRDAVEARVESEYAGNPSILVEALSDPDLRTDHISVGEYERLHVVNRSLTINVRRTEGRRLPIGSTHIDGEYVGTVTLNSEQSWAVFLLRISTLTYWPSPDSVVIPVALSLNGGEFKWINGPRSKLPDDLAVDGASASEGMPIGVANWWPTAVALTSQSIVITSEGALTFEIPLMAIEP